MPHVDKVSILLLSYNGRRHLESCLPALAAQRGAGVDVEVLVLDNGGIDDTSDWVRAHHPQVRLLRSEANLGFCAGNNHLAEAADGDALILLNDDTRPEVDWLASLVAAWRDAGDDVGAMAGLILDWEGERLDFGRGVMTFDGHAFQDGYLMPLEKARAEGRVPAPGDELPFACGGNMIIRRHVFDELGGFEPSFFAYLEDVDLGWRLWSAGWRILSAPGAVVRHRSMATSQQLGNANRGFLFERNAFLTMARNLDDASRSRLLPAVWMTLVHRTQTLMVQNNPGGELLTLDPYAGLIAHTARPEGASQAPNAPATDPPKTSLATKWRGYGPREFLRRGLRKAARLALPTWIFDESAPATQLVDARSVAQLRAITWLLGHLDEIEASRRRVQALRKRPDRELFERFPLHVVPTYPGDKRLFATEAFEAALGGTPVVRRTLEDLMPRT